MHVTLKIILITLIISPNSGGVKLRPTCDMSQCEGYHQLTPHRIKKPNIEITRTKVKVIEGMSDITLIYVKRRWLSIYCYDGSSIDPNTGCYETIETKNPTCSEAKEWVKSDLCPTGWECAPDGECTGRDANIKCYDGETIKENKGPKSLKWEGSRYMVFPKHTCTSSWECNIFTNVVPIFGKFNQRGNMEWVFYDKDNREHKIEDNVLTKGIVNPTGEILCPMEESSEPLIRIEEADCYSESKSNIKCIIRSKNELDGIVFDVSNTGGGVLRNMILEVVGPLLVPENGKIINLVSYELDGVSNIPTTLMDRQRSVNVETAHELALGANVLQMQSLYNILSLSQEIDELYNVVLHLIRSQSIDDPMLLSKVMGLPNFAIKWDNEEIFEKCRCIQTSPMRNSNCMDGKMFSFGSYIENSDVSRCFHIPEESIQNVTLVNKTAVSLDLIKYLPPQTASSDSSAWDALNDYRNTLIGGDRTAHSYRNLENQFSELKEMLNLGSFYKWFTYLTNVVVWVTFFMVLCRLRN